MKEAAWEVRGAQKGEMGKENRLDRYEGIGQRQ